MIQNQSNSSFQEAVAPGHPYIAAQARYDDKRRLTRAQALPCAEAEGCILTVESSSPSYEVGSAVYAHDRGTPLWSDSCAFLGRGQLRRLCEVHFFCLRARRPRWPYRSSSRHFERNRI